MSLASVSLASVSLASVSLEPRQREPRQREPRQREPRYLPGKMAIFENLATFPIFCLQSANLDVGLSESRKQSQIKQSQTDANPNFKNFEPA